MALNAATSLFVVLSIWAFSGAHSATPHHSPAPAVDCDNLILNMAECLSYVTNDSKVQKPEGSCCAGLTLVLKTDADCLCMVFKSSAQLGVALNVTKALTLPSACHVSAPSISNCGLNKNRTGGAPAPAPVAAGPPSSPAAPSGPSGGTPSGGGPAPAQGGSSSSSSLIVSTGSTLLAVGVALFSLF